MDEKPTPKSSMANRTPSAEIARMASSTTGSSATPSRSMISRTRPMPGIARRARSTTPTKRGSRSCCAETFTLMEIGPPAAARSSAASLATLHEHSSPSGTTSPVASAIRMNSSTGTCDAVELPADQGLDTDDPVGLRGDDGLVDDVEGIGLEGPAQLLDELQALHPRPPDRRLVGHGLGLPASLGLVHRQVGVAQQGLRRLAARAERDADRPHRAGPESDRCGAPAQAGEDAVGDLDWPRRR